jgi:UDP-2,3-diacylglucosamine pyrophosphatase LpxH
MLAVISDLHFEEEVSNHIVGDGRYPPVIFSRNLSPLPYRRFIAQLAEEALRNGAQRLDLVLAGDIFDINRTVLWFMGEEQIRPYIDAGAVSGAVEERIIQILRAIAQEPKVAATLAAFRLLANGRYQSYGNGLPASIGPVPGDSLAGERDFPVPVTLHYIPGNHDRLANASPAIRRTVRELVGLPNSADPFRRSLAFDEEHALVRHGHEYDPYNFAENHTKTDEFPIHLPEAQYDGPTFGDFVTVDIAGRFPYLFRAHHGDDQILADPLLRQVYLRLLEFDDLRPQSALLHFLLHMPESQMNPPAVWRLIEPVIRQLLELIHDDPYLHHWLGRLNRQGLFDPMNLIRILLRLKVWRWRGIPLPVAQYLSNAAVRRHENRRTPETFAIRESSIRLGRHLFLICGHTHAPRVSLIGNDKCGERYYIDTGTWRNQVPSSPDYTAFGRLKALTYAVLYGPNEDRGNPPQVGKIASLDYWTGVTQRWVVDS